MLLPNFTLLEPGSVPEACSLLARHVSDGVRVLAGGTDILVDLKQRIFPDTQRMKPPAFLVSLCRIPELRTISVTDGSIRIGALVTMTEICDHPVIVKKLRALCEGAGEVGSPLVRNRGTLGGNLANARPAADTSGPVIALGGKIITGGVGGERVISSEEFFTGPGKNVLLPDEIIRAIRFDLPDAPAGSSYVKLATRRALDISVVGVSASLVLGGDRTIQQARLCLTSVGPTPILSRNAADALIGNVLTDETLEAAREGAVADARPIDDYRGSAWYRREMVGLLTKRMVVRAWERATGEVRK